MIPLVPLNKLISLVALKSTGEGGSTKIALARMTQASTA
ncbi:hypothetical protein VCR26J2_370796 [Vibrio coralliirubri]|nr:hypothetical protein VCR26J2_370796 [Vibrio coralliirubri]